MFKRIPFLTILLLSSTVALVQAEPDTPKVVVVNIQEIGQKSKKFSAVQKRIESDVTKRGMEIESLKNQYMEIVNTLQNGAKDMKASVLQEKQEKLASLKGQIEVKQQALQAYAEREMRSAEESLVKEIQAICKKMNWDIVIPGALYVKPAFDQTAAVIKEMDANVKDTSPSTLKKLENELEDVAKKVKKAL